MANYRVAHERGKWLRQGETSGVLATLFLVSMAGCAHTSGSGTVPGQSNLAPTGASSATESPLSAVAAFHQQQYAKAIELFTQQLQPGTKDEPKLWFNLGASHWNTGQKRESLDAYEQAAALNPLYLKAHQRLGAHFKALGSKGPASQHLKVATTIQRVEKMLAPAWDKAQRMRAKGPIYFKAQAKLHDTAAETYDKAGFPPQAEAERKLAILSRQDEERERRQPMEAAQHAQAEADERAFNTELLGTVKDLSATFMKVNPDVAFSAPATGGIAPSGLVGQPSQSLGGESGRTAIAGLGILESSLSGYAGMMQAFEGKLQQEQESTRQQGQQAQTALANPNQAHAQQDARQRSDALRHRLEEVERTATQLLIEEGQFEDLEPIQDRDTLDL